MGGCGHRRESPVAFVRELLLGKSMWGRVVAGAKDGAQRVPSGWVCAGAHVARPPPFWVSHRPCPVGLEARGGRRACRPVTGSHPQAQAAGTSLPTSPAAPTGLMGGP